MTAKHARELAGATPQGVVCKINKVIERAARDGNFSCSHHLKDDEDPLYISEICGLLEKSGFVVKLVTFAYNQNCNILDISWVE